MPTHAQEKPLEILAVRQADLDRLFQEVAELRREIQQVKREPVPELMTVKDYARFIDKSTRTVMRRIEEGTVKTRHVGGVRMVVV